MSDFETFIANMKFSDTDDFKNSYSITELNRNNHPINLAIHLPSDVNTFYNHLNNDEIYIMFKMFNFKPYKKIMSDYFNRINNKLHIGDIYQGMGYYVALYYDYDTENYFFIEQRGGCYQSRLLNQTNLEELQLININKFKTLMTVLG